jgi:hypothetical protein
VTGPCSGVGVGVGLGDSVGEGATVGVLVAAGVEVGTTGVAVDVSVGTTCTWAVAVACWSHGTGVGRLGSWRWQAAPVRAIAIRLMISSA